MTEYKNDLAAERWLSEKVAEGNVHAKMIREHMDAMRDANATAYAAGALDELRRHPPQATATEAREGTFNHDEIEDLLYAVVGTIDGCALTEEGKASFAALDAKLRKLLQEPATVPSEAAGEAGRLMAWAADPGNSIGGLSNGKAWCNFCSSETEIFKDWEAIPHKTDCLHLWAVTQLAASPRPEAEAGLLEKLNFASDQIALDNETIVRLNADLVLARDALATAVAERSEAKRANGVLWQALEIIRTSTTENGWVLVAPQFAAEALANAAPQPSTDATVTGKGGG